MDFSRLQQTRACGANPVHGLLIERKRAGLAPAGVLPGWSGFRSISGFGKKG